MDDTDLDPRWNWVAVPDHPGQDPVPYVKGSCRHLPGELIPVESVTGELVAKICGTCGTQFTLACQWEFS